MNSNLTYRGSVEVIVGTKHYRLHNTGTDYLLQMLVKILCGEVASTKNLDLPRYFMLYAESPKSLINNYNVGANSTKQLLKDFIRAEAQSDFTRGKFDGIFTATITGKNLVSRASSGIGGLALALVGGSDDSMNILAAVDFDPDVFEILKMGGQAVMKWTMSVANDTDIEEV